MDQDEDGVPIGSVSHLTSQISFSSVDYTVNATGSAQGVCGGDSDVISGDSSTSVVTTIQELGKESLYFNLHEAIPSLLFLSDAFPRSSH